MKKKEVLSVINDSFIELEKFEKSHNLPNFEKKVVSEVKSTLNMLKGKLINNNKLDDEEINKLNLLGQHSYKVFENTALEELLPKITYYFRKRDGLNFFDLLLGN